MSGLRAEPNIQQSDNGSYKSYCLVHNRRFKHSQESLYSVQFTKLQPTLHFLVSASIRSKKWYFSLPFSPFSYLSKL